MVPVDGTRIHHEGTPETQDMIDLVEVVQEIVVTDDLAEMRAAATDEPVVRTRCERCKHGQQQIRRIERIRQNGRSSPGVVADPVHDRRTLAAGSRGESLRIVRVELRQGGGTEGPKRSDRVLWLVRVREQRDEVDDRRAEESQERAESVS